MRFSLRAADVDIDEHEESRLTLEFSAESLGNVLEHVDRFLRGCGFVPRGELQYVEDEETPKGWAEEAFPDEEADHAADECPACEGDS